MSDKSSKYLKNLNNTNDTSMGAHISKGMESDSGAMTSDEELAAYADRRNGIGPRLVPALQNKKRNFVAAAAATTVSHQYSNQKRVQQNQNMASSFSCNGLVTTLKSDASVVNLCNLDHLKNGLVFLFFLFMYLNIDYLEPLNVNMDPIIVLKRMAMPDSGLIIKDRKWLKIPVLNSFIGLVNMIIFYFILFR